GTDVFHAAILLWAASAAHVAAGNVDFGLAGNILVGSVPGVWLGSSLTLKVPAGVLRTTLGLVLIGAGLGLLTKAGVGVPAVVIAAFPGGGAVTVVGGGVRGGRVGREAAGPRADDGGGRADRPWHHRPGGERRGRQEDHRLRHRLPGRDQGGGRWRWQGLRGGRVRGAAPGGVRARRPRGREV